MYKICIYAICKNENKNILKWYNSVKEADAIVVIDTGSEDDSLELLKSCGGNLHAFQFVQEGTFNFSVARNYALNQARSICQDGAWVYVTLDLDEFLEDGGIKKIRESWSDEYDTLMLRAQTNEQGDSMFVNYKIHSSNPEWGWRRNVHEIICLPTKTMSDWITGTSDITYVHEQDLTKVRDYYEMLKTDYVANPTDIKTLIYLSWEAINHGEGEAANEYAQQAVEQILTNKNDEFYLDYEYLIQAYLNCAMTTTDNAVALDNLNKAVTIVEKGKFPPIKRVYMKRAELLGRMSKYDLAISDYRKALSIKERPFCWVEEDYDEAEIYSQLSTAYYYNYNYVEALAFAECALALNSSNIQYIINRDYCRDRVKEYNPMSQPTQNKICVYAMCKNESQFVDKWLESMSEADYIVVLDTGSEDNTYELLKNDPRVYRAEQKVITPWRFDVARNESMQLIPDDANILVCTDLDELLDPGWADALRAKWIEGVHRRGVYKYAWSHNELGEPSVVFQYDKVHSRGWVWNFPVHEALVHEDDLLNMDYYDHEILNIFDEMFLHHYPDQTKSRGSYLPLLELRKQENPQDYCGKIYLAHEYYYRGLYQKSIDELQDILDNYATAYNQIEQASCYLFMGDSYRAMGNLTEAIVAYQRGIQKDNTYREPYVNLAEVLNELGYYNQAIGVIQDCFNKTYRHYNWLERGTSWQHEPYDALSVSYYWIGDYQASYDNVLKALEYCPSDSRILYNLELIENQLKQNTGALL